MPSPAAFENQPVEGNSDFLDYIENKYNTRKTEPARYIAPIDEIVMGMQFGLEIVSELPYYPVLALGIVDIFLEEGILALTNLLTNDEYANARAIDGFLDNDLIDFSRVATVFEAFYNALGTPIPDDFFDAFIECCIVAPLQLLTMPFFVMGTAVAEMVKAVLCGFIILNQFACAAAQMLLNLPLYLLDGCNYLIEAIASCFEESAEEIEDLNDALLQQALLEDAVIRRQAQQAPVEGQAAPEPEPVAPQISDEGQPTTAEADLTDITVYHSQRLFQPAVYPSNINVDRVAPQYQSTDATGERAFVM